MGPASGKSIVALGLVELLARRVPRVGFYRPIVQRLPDNDLDLIGSRYQMPEERIGYAFTAAERTLAGGATSAGMERIVERFREIEAASDFVVVEGTDFTGASSPVELEVNARISEHLGAPIVAVVDGYRCTASAIVDRIAVGRDSLGDDAIAAIIVNRVDAAVLDPLDEALTHVDLGHRVWAIPEEPRLRRPSLDQLRTALGAELVGGDPDDLPRPVGQIKVAAMSVPNVLDHVVDGTVFIVPGDRSDVIVAAAMTRLSSAYPSVSGLLLSGGLRPDPRVIELIGTLSGGTSMPLLAVDTDTFDTAIAASHVEGAITAGDQRKIDVALGHFEAHVDLDALEERIEVGRSEVMTPVTFQYELIERARAAHAHIVLPEGTDDRILHAADRIRRRQVCDLTLLGPTDAVRNRIAELGLRLDDVPVIDPLDTELLDRFGDRYFELRGHKGIDRLRAHDIMTDVSYFGTMMVRRGPRRRDGVGRCAHHGAHDPSLARVHQDPAGNVDRVERVPDAARRPGARLRRLRGQPRPERRAARRHRHLVGGDRGDVRHRATGGDAELVDGRVRRGRRGREGARCDRAGAPAATGPEGGGPDPVRRGGRPRRGAQQAARQCRRRSCDGVRLPRPQHGQQHLQGGAAVGRCCRRRAGACRVSNKPVNDLSRGATVTDIVNTIAITAVQVGAGRA